MVPRRRPHQLPTEHTHHVRGIHAIPALGLDSVDRGPIRDLARLQPDVEKARLNNGPRDGVQTRVGADADSREADGFADDDGEEGLGAFHDGAGVDGAPGHGGDADEGEEADGEGCVVVRGAGEEEGQGRPEGGEGGGCEEADEAGLDEDGVFEEEFEDVEEEGRVFPDDFELRVGGGVVRHEEVEEDEDEVLQGESDPVDVPPADEACDDAGQGAGDQHAEEHSGDDDAEGSGAAVWGCHVADEWEHELWGDCRNGCDEGDGAEGGEGVRYAEPDPASVRLSLCNTSASTSRTDLTTKSQ